MLCSLQIKRLCSFKIFIMNSRVLFCMFLIHAVQSVKLEGVIFAKNIIFENVERSIDLSTQIAKIGSKMQIKNAGPPIDFIIYSSEGQDVTNLALVSAQQLIATKVNLKVQEFDIAEQDDKKFWKIFLNGVLPTNEITTIEVMEFWTSSILPHPQYITQKEKQLVRYIGNAHLFTPYTIKKMMTTVTLHTRNVEFYTKVKPSASSDGVVTYGPFQQLQPFSIEKITLHYENNAPFLVIKHLERAIEVSHWGNIAVEESVELVHLGAKLKGSFSRYDYQRESGTGQSSVKSFKMMLPAAAVGTYYRDDIGNISTSYMRVMKDAVELELRPRFPLFGGWQTKYVTGYNIPSYEYLYNSEDNYVLKMRLMDHLYDDMVVEKLTTKIFLPEGVHTVDLSTPYTVKRLPDSLHHTYLDTKGRLVITLEKENLVENYIQDFVLKYKFSSLLMFQEPLMVVVALYSFFLLIILYARLDFSIAKDSATESKMRVASFREKVMIHQDKRSYLYELFESRIQKLKSSKDINSFLLAVKNLNNEHKAETNAIAELAQKLKPEAPDVYDKIQEIQKLDRTLKEVYFQHQSICTDKLIIGKIGRLAFVEAENSFYKKKNDLISSLCNVYRSLE